MTKYINAIYSSRNNFFSETKQDSEVILAKLRKLTQMEVMDAKEAKKRPIFKVPAPVSPQTIYPELQVSRLNHLPVKMPLRSSTKKRRIHSSTVTTVASSSQSMTLATSTTGAKISPTKRLRITPRTSPVETPRRSSRDSTTRSPGGPTAGSPRGHARSSKPSKTSSKDLSEKQLTQTEYELEDFSPSSEYTPAPGVTIIYECPFCYTTCKSEGEMDDHLLFQCMEIGRFQCPYCQEKRKSQIETFFHVDVMHPGKERCIFDWLESGYLKQPMAELEWKERESNTDF